MVQGRLGVQVRGTRLEPVPEVESEGQMLGLLEPKTMMTPGALQRRPLETKSC